MGPISKAFRWIFWRFGTLVVIVIYVHFRGSGVNVFLQLICKGSQYVSIGNR